MLPESQSENCLGVSSPVWQKHGTTDDSWSQSYVTDGTSHVTTIDITQYGGNLYSFMINGLNTTVPN